MNAIHRHLPLALGLIVGLSFCTTPALSTKTRPEVRTRPAVASCPTGRYVVSGEPIVAGRVEPVGGSVLIGQSHVSIDNMCDAKRARKMKANRRGIKKVRARWRACDGLKGRVRFRGKIVQNCRKLRGRLRAGNFERRFEAQLTRAVADLQVAGSYDEVREAFQERAISQMQRAIETAEQRALWLLQQGCREPDDRYRKAGGPEIIAADLPPGNSDVGSGTENEATSYSTTNTQVEGVDEADFVKNDGSFIYILADGALQIIAAWPPERGHRVSSTEIEGEAKKLFVHGDRAVVYSSIGRLPTMGLDTPRVQTARYLDRECTYGYDCEFLGDGAFLKITVLDISDRAEPRLLRETVFEGSYLNSRRIEDAIYTAVIFPERPLPDLSYWPQELLRNEWYCGDELRYDESGIKALFDNLRRENTERIRQEITSQSLPGMADIRYVDGAPMAADSPLVDCQNFLIPQEGDARHLISLVAFNVDALGDYQVTMIAGPPGAVYASGESLYVAARQYRQQMDSWYFEPGKTGWTGAATAVHKFVLTPQRPASEYAGSGVVRGHILNQFSMDEHQGYLRIATTDRAWRMTTDNRVSVLAEVPGGLEVVGQIDGIAPTEDIRSARFRGDVGFIVTFKKTDPLFVLDLSDPADPSIKGELKIPGFSTYMHLMDAEHLLTIGYDADDQGSFAWFSGIQLQIIDVGNLSKPRLIHKEIIGTRGSTSDAATNHLAFNYFASKDLLAIPRVICEGRSGAGAYGESMTFSGLLVYRTTVEDGFERLGGVPHKIKKNAPPGCYNWWTNGNSQVKRSIFMDDFVYSIALDRINISSLGNLENPVAVVKLIE